ncbi:ABC transporter ATP-binding protein [Anabaena sp. CS-542/02]|uniref:ABC transporter ATP-binding protein n=1 Tax=Anabaena sp. CS-542/02 TaxID=3021719 RepID=UPI00232CACC6|nr:ABC transporter ATP-binding protein [Anabaena sp. CS-542/02]MDB9447885.1 ABC transporter ATP-binding protein [Anabaena sp. CS-542/02]
MQKLIKKIPSRWWKKYHTPAYQQIGVTINHNLGLVVLTFVSNLVAALLETLTLGIIFLALGVLQDNQLPELPSAVTSALPWLAQRWRGESQGIFLGLIGLAVFLQLSRSIMTYVSAVATGDLTARIQAQMTETIFARIISLSFPCASRYKVGDLTTYVGQAGSTVDLQMRLWSGALTGVMMVLAYSVTVLTISVPLSAVALLLFIFLVWFQRWLIPRIRAVAMKLSQAQVEVNKDMVENIQGLRLVHTFGRQEQTIDRVKHLQHQVLEFSQRQVRLMSITGPLNNALTIFLIAGLLVTGSLLLKQGDRGVLPALATFVLALNRLSGQVQGLAGTMNGLAENYGRMGRLDAILSSQDQEFTRGGGEVFEGLQSCISFTNVTLEYDGTSTPALSEVSFKLPKNTVLALVGESGAGKSSIADLLIGLYAPTTGQILVDGLDLQTYSWESWRSKLGVVSQDTFIFNQSILENIRYGLPTATDTAVQEAARLAQADQFIQALPQGYQTVVGERGYRLSGGQRQRLALARAILKQPEILILDEATSALDSQSERLVQEALNQFECDRTVLVIAHRLSTIVNADQIIVMERGRVVEQGQHQDLLTLGGKYASYWALQSAKVEVHH